MKELSLHVLDIAQNSISAKADLIQITISEKDNQMIFDIKDNGCGMSEEMLSKVIDPFTTTRTTRRVGLGIPLLKFAAEQTGGSFTIESHLSEGTHLCASFVQNSIDCLPIGDIGGTMAILLQGLPLNIRLIYKHEIDEKSFELDTNELREILGPDISFSEPEIAMWLSEYIKENEEMLK